MTTEKDSGRERESNGEGDDNPKEPSMIPVVASGAIVLGMAVGGALIGRRFGHPVIGAAGALVVSLPVANWVGGALTDALSDEVNPTVAPPREREGDGPGRRRMPRRNKDYGRSGETLTGIDNTISVSDELLIANIPLFTGKR